jgi:hypothetical protein
VTSAASARIELSLRSGPPLMVRVAPAVIGLLYPALVWSVHAISPFALALTLLAPAACLYTVRRLADENHYHRATMVAYFGVGAPALYTFLGGWLDSQKWLPFRGNGVWIVIWSALVMLTILEKPTAIEGASTRPAKLAFAHGVSAALITTFAVFHLNNHLAGVLGGEMHIAVMRHLRLVYRYPVIEVLLGSCVLFQVASGSVLLFRRMRRSSPGWIEILQNASGAYYFINTEIEKEQDMAKNHYSTKPKRRNRSGKRKDTPRIATNMAKIKELERKQGRTA